MYKHQKSVPKLSFIVHSGTDFLYYSYKSEYPGFCSNALFLRRS